MARGVRVQQSRHAKQAKQAALQLPPNTPSLEWK